MKHSLTILANELVAAEKSAAHYTRYADDNERAAKQATELAAENRTRAAADKARADDIRTAIEVLEQANQPKELWGIFYNHDGTVLRSVDYPAVYGSESAAKAVISTIRVKYKYEAKRVD